MNAESHWLHHKSDVMIKSVLKNILVIDTLSITVI